MPNKTVNRFRVLLAASSFALLATSSALGAETHTLEAEKAERIGGASMISDHDASGSTSVALSDLGQAIRFNRMPAASKLAIRYASVTVGTISVAVNDQPARKVNVHSSGALTGSFLHAIIELPIPANATLTISRGDRTMSR